MDKATAILVVDDDRVIREALRLILEMDGYRVLTARDGAEALVVLRSQPVDSIVADVTMPQMDGYQLYESVNANPQWASIPFLFLTGCRLEGKMRDDKRLGVGDYLAKPFEIADLLSAVRRKSRRAQQPIG